MIELKNVTKRFGQKPAVQQLSFSVKKGEVVGLLGPNGAGKTTTMRLVTGYLVPNEGEITVAGHSVIDEPLLAQARLGYMPENNPLYKDMLVSEFLKYSAALRQIPKNHFKKAFDFVVEHTAINEVFYQPINELSKGYRQRVGLAAALIHQPDILILDEPTEGLDPNQRGDVRALIKKLAKNHTVILSTHVLPEAAAMCNRLLIINQGALVADGTTAQLNRRARGQRSLKIDLEGKNVLTALKAVPGLAAAETLEKSGASRWVISVSAEGDAELRPAISAAARENGWTIWHLSEETGTLEDIFKDLTEKP